MTIRVDQSESEGRKAVGCPYARMLNRGKKACITRSPEQRDVEGKSGLPDNENV